VEEINKYNNFININIYLYSVRLFHLPFHSYSTLPLFLFLYSTLYLASFHFMWRLFHSFATNYTKINIIILNSYDTSIPLFHLFHRFAYMANFYFLLEIIAQVFVNITIIQIIRHYRSRFFDKIKDKASE